MGGSTVANTPLQDFWTNRRDVHLFDMDDSTVIYGTCL